MENKKEALPKQTLPKNLSYYTMLRKRCKADSHVMLVLDYIMKNGGISTRQAFQELECTRLSGRIKDLRNMGVPIINEWHTSSEGKRYVVYRLGGNNDLYI